MHALSTLLALQEFMQWIFNTFIEAICRCTTEVMDTVPLILAFWELKGCFGVKSRSWKVLTDSTSRK